MLQPLEDSLTTPTSTVISRFSRKGNVFLTLAIKESIIKFKLTKSKMTPGRLFKSLHRTHNGILLYDVKRWMKAHPWITRADLDDDDRPPWFHKLFKKYRKLRRRQEDSNRIMVKGELTPDSTPSRKTKSGRLRQPPVQFHDLRFDLIAQRRKQTPANTQVPMLPMGLSSPQGNTSFSRLMESDAGQRNNSGIINGIQEPHTGRLRDAPIAATRVEPLVNAVSTNQLQRSPLLPPCRVTNILIDQNQNMSLQPISGFNQRFENVGATQIPVNISPSMVSPQSTNLPQEFNHPQPNCQKGHVAHSHQRNSNSTGQQPPIGIPQLQVQVFSINRNSTNNGFVAPLPVRDVVPHHSTNIAIPSVPNSTQSSAERRFSIVTTNDPPKTDDEKEANLTKHFRMFRHIFGWGKYFSSPKNLRQIFEPVYRATTRSLSQIFPIYKDKLAEVDIDMTD